MYTPNPILLAETPAGGHVLPVTADQGGLNGYILLGQLGPPATVEVSADGVAWQAPTYPHTLAAGETLRLTRTDTSAVLTTLRALAPVDEGAAPGPETPDLQNGVPVAVPDLARNAQQVYGLRLPAGVAQLTVALSGGTGDVDLTVARAGNTGAPDGESYEVGNEERVTIASPAAGAWVVTLAAYEPSSGVTLTAAWGADASPPAPEPLAVSTDPQGYQTLTNADATTDADGYQTLPDGTATADADGYESVERSGA